MNDRDTARPRGPLEVAARRTRVRRVAAFAGMLTTVAGLVWARAALTPAPHQALNASGVVAHAGKPHGRHPGKRHTHGGGGPNPAPSRRHTASPSPPAQHSPRARPTQRVVVGKAYDVSYGTVQVKVTLTGSRITDVTPLSLPQGGRSSDISAYAAPQLRREALSAQSAHIDTVSGASYTSAGYAMSLQSALDASRG